MTKADIERELHGKGDFVLIDNITRFLKEHHPLDTKKFLYGKLIEVYEKRNMFTEAAKLYEGLAELSVTFDEKIKQFVNAAEDYIRGGLFDRADYAMKKALSEAMPNERPKIFLKVKEFYRKQAEIYEKDKRRNNAVKIYERILNMNISDMEKDEIRKKLLVLYENLGMVRDYMEMKKRVSE